MGIVARVLILTAVIAVGSVATDCIASISLGKYSFTGSDPAGDGDTPNANSTSATGAVFSAFGRTGVNAVSTVDAFNSDNWLPTAEDPSVDANGLAITNYISFTVSFSSLYTLESLNFTGQASNTGPDEIYVSMSKGTTLLGTFASVVINSSSNYTFNFADFVPALTDTIEFRFEAHGDTQADGVGVPAAGGTWRIDNVELFGTPVSTQVVPEASAALIWSILCGSVLVGAKRRRWLDSD